MEKVINKVYKYRIYPNNIQIQKLANYFGTVRFVYNYFLNERLTQYKETGKSDNYYVQAKKLTLLKKEESFAWLNNVAALSSQYALKHLENAYVNFFTKKSGFPKFHKKSSRQSFSSNQNIHFKGDKICFVGFKDGLKCKKHRYFEGKIKELTIVKYPSNKYYVNIVVEQTINYNKNTNKSIGIDLGISNLLITSDGRKYDNPKFIEKYQNILKNAQQHLSRKKKGSHQFESQKLKVARIQEKISNCRKDNLHKISYHLVKNYSDIFIEDLNVQKMQKDKHLSKLISDCGWSMFTNMLEYKGKWYGCDIHKINRYFASSKTCSNCNYTLSNLKLSIREWDCPNCHSHHDRDINAAKNILLEGLRELSAGTVDYTDGESVRIRRRKKSNLDSMKSEAFSL